ncbi:hypothetical protein LDG_6179 [Legionella drancourtii LLAP12]|uniref:Uncharacterized protein n=1 Tax=Legionella drancourtii LLAP12 TaxID=658187 RepID=G9ELB7_9GAMM|nr:hypothetical protein LDG_6179 [Legionella drancourtii LLAP12]
MSNVMIIINQMGLHLNDKLVNFIHIFEYLEAIRKVPARG